jgi:asparagine synthase (glutamine-hydrolysing)
MCGIAGIYNNDFEPVESGVLRRMLDTIRHRGPDDEGVFVDGHSGLGMRRLSIIDLAGGHQPIASEDGAVVCVLNGEIYNYRELRSSLRFRGHRFATASDTEVLVHLYEDLGDECVHELRGMFAFAIWDRRRRRLLVARDRLGIKPLYYCDAADSLLFASEIKALLVHPAVTAVPDLEAIGNFLSLKYVPAPQTMFRGISALPPGHLLTCGPEGIAVRSYWDLSFRADHDPTLSDGEHAEALAALLRESVKLHLVSDVPFGAFLSGGVDSSTVVALMTEALSEPVKTFSVGFEGDGEAYSELPYARLVAERCATDHHEVIVGARDLIDEAERVVWHLDQPIADEACLANYLVSRLASQHVKMVLTGEGGDELFAGYARYAGNRLAPLFEFLPGPVRWSIAATSQRVPWFRRQKLAMYALCQSQELTRLVNWFPLFNPEAKAALLAPACRAELNGSSPNDVFAWFLNRTDATDPLSRMLYVDTKLWLPDDLLARGDKTSMAASIEARVPLLDHKVVEFAASLPPHFKLRGFARKYLLKQVARSLLPASIIDRKKKGFPIPLSLWFRKEARALVRDVLSPSAVRRRGLFDPPAVERLIVQNETGRANHGPALWAILSLELWHRLFIDAAQPAPSQQPIAAMPAIALRQAGAR